jgi:hypothetical protein
MSAIDERSGLPWRKAYIDVLVPLERTRVILFSAGEDETHLVYMKLMIDSKRLGTPRTEDVDLQLQWHNGHYISTYGDAR